MKELSRKYLPDILINIGVWLFSIGILLPQKAEIISGFRTHLRYVRYENMEIFWLELFGIMLITTGVNIAIREYLQRKH